MAFLILLLFSHTAFAETVPLQEADLPKLVAARSNVALGAEDQTQAAQQLTGHLSRSYLPHIEAKLGAENFKTGTHNTLTQPFGGLEATMNLFNAGIDRLEDQLRNENLRALQARSAQVYRQELKKARIAFWTLISQKELQVLLEEALKENSKNLGSANTRIRAGAATDTDRLEFEMYRVELEQDLARLHLAVESSRRELAAILNIPPADIQTPNAIIHDHDDSFLNATVKAEEHPDVRSIASQVSIAGLRRSQIRRTWLPKLDLFANHTLYTFREREYEDQNNRWDTVLGVQLKMELYNGGNTYVESSSLALEAAGLERQALQTRTEISNQFETAKAELKLTHQLVHDSEETLRRSSRYFSRSMDEYRRGVKNSLDVLNVSQRTLAVRKRAAELRRDYQIARADLLEALGK